MKKMKQSVKTAVASTVILSSTVAAVYAVPQIIEKSSKGTGNELKLDVEKIDRDTVKVSIDNIQDIPKALQFSIKLDGDVELKDGPDSIEDLIKPEVEARLANNEYSENSNNVLTDYTYNKATNTIDVLITSDNSIPKTENRVEVFKLDIKPKETVKAAGTTYKVVPNNEDDYKYLSVTNKEYDNLGVTSDDESISMNSQPTIKASNDYITIKEGEELELTADKLGLVIEDADNDDTTLEVRDLSQGNKPVIEKFVKTTPGVYNLECIATDSFGEKSTAIQIPVYVQLDDVKTAPTITRDGKELQNDIEINGGDVFKPLENVKATDAKGRNVEVTIESSAELNLDPENDTTYTLTYKATDIYGNEARKEVTLHVIANKAPVIDGVRDHSIKVGDKFDPKDGVTVTDEDTDIELKVESNVNTAIPGEYKVSYSATDSKGKTTRAQSKVVVNEKMVTMNSVPFIYAKNQTIQFGQTFDPRSGIAAYDKEDGNLTSEIKIEENNVNENKVGKYTVKYSVEDKNGAKATRTIMVTVEDKEAPVFNYDGERDVVLVQGEEYIIPEIEATDNADGKQEVTRVITKDDVVIDVIDTNVPGKYKITYTAVDKSGNSSELTISVVVNKKIVAMNSIPVIIAKDQTIQVGDKFKPLSGVVAYDKEDKDLTSKIKVEENNVDENKVGQYTVRYSVQDSKGAKVTKTITVTVEDKEAPVFNYDGERDVVLVQGEEYIIPEIEATDNADGKLEVTRVITKDDVVIDKIDTNVPGTYKITYTAVDKSGNSSELTISVTVKDKIEIVGGEGTINSPTKIQLSEAVIIEDVKELISKIEKLYSYEFTKAPEVIENNKVYTLKIKEKLNIFVRLFAAKTNVHYIEIEIPNSNNDVIAYLDGLYAEVNAPVDEEKPGNGSITEGGEGADDQETPDNSSKPENGSGSQVEVKPEGGSGSQVEVKPEGGSGSQAQSKPNNTSKVENQVATTAQSTNQSTTSNTSNVKNEVAVEEQTVSNETSKVEDKVESNNEVKLDNDLASQENEATETEKSGMLKVVIAGVVATLAGAMVYLNKKRKS